MMTRSDAKRLHEPTYHGRIHQPCGTTEKRTHNSQCIACARTYEQSRTANGYRRTEQRRVHQRRYRRRRYATCADVRATIQQYQQHHKHTDGRQAAQFKYRLKTMNMTRADFDTMLIMQSGRCASCGCPLVTGPAFRGHDCELCLDHDHAVTPVRVRALLCRRCNRDGALDTPPLPLSIVSRRRIRRFFEMPLGEAVA